MEIQRDYFWRQSLLGTFKIMAGYVEAWHSREVLLSDTPCIWLFMVLVSQRKIRPFSHLYIVDGVICHRLFPYQSGDSLTQLKTSLESYGLVKKVWGHLKSLSHLHWNKYNSAMVQDLTPGSYYKISLLCQNLTVRPFHKNKQANNQ